MTDTTSSQGESGNSPGEAPPAVTDETVVVVPSINFDNAPRR